MQNSLKKQFVDTILNPESSSDILTDRTQRKIYNSWRIRILLSVVVGYATYYLLRQNFSMAMPALMAEFNYTKTQMGWILSYASIVYGVGKFVNGYLSDKSNARVFMSIGLAASAVLTFFMGFSQGLVFIGALWIMNNWFQSMGWPPAARMLTHWFSPGELGTKWALGATSHQIGGAVTMVVCGYIVANLGWQYAFFIPGVIGLLMALFLYERLRDSPKKLDLPTVEKYKGEVCFSDTEEAHLPTKELLMRVFSNKLIWYICLANMSLYVVRLGVIYWAPMFLKELKGISLTTAGWQVAACEVFGLLGGVSAGWMSDKIFKGRRGPVGTVFMVALAGSLALFWYMPEGQDLLSALAMVFVGFFVYGPQVLVGVASADFASKRAIGTANGLAGTFAYIGSALAGVCVGHIADVSGWGGVFVFFIASAFMGAFFFALTWKHRAASK